jgi:hypothetical protein
MSAFAARIPEELKYENHFGFPYKTTLSFVPYIEWLEDIVKKKEAPDAPVFRYVLKIIKKIPELLAPIEDLSVVEKYRKEVNLLLSTIIPSSSHDITGVVIPFQPVTIYATEKFTELVGNEGRGTWNIKEMNPKNVVKDLTAFAGLAILENYYGLHTGGFVAMKSKEIDKLSGTTRYLKPEVTARFARVKLLKEPRPISEIDLSPLNKNFFDREFWLKNFPPDTFCFEGFTVYHMVDISDRELISQLEYMLLENSSSMTHEQMNRIEANLRDFFKVPDLKMGIANMSNYQRVMGCSEEQWFCLLPLEKIRMLTADLENSVYQQAIQTGTPVLIDDLEKIKNPSAIEKELLNLGYHSFMLSPVYNGKELMGTVEMGSMHPNAFNFLSVLKMKEILPIISLAFQREIETYANRVQSAMKEHFTAIHPVVEWKFEEAVMQAISVNADTNKLPEIMFDDVFPVYGQIDVRGSSDKRNDAIRLDMIDYLSKANAILKEAYAKHAFSLLDELMYRTERHLDKLHLSIDSGDETGIIDFMNQEVEPVLKIVAEREPSINKVIDEFLHPPENKDQFFHKRRTEFETSLTMINDHVANIIDEEEQRTQQLFPHYFEKYKTDGIEYNIYLGQSLMREGNFDPTYIKGFRLWQLINMINIAREIKKIQSKLPVPLETTQLILCYSNPFSIMFRMDEKRFDVAGAYNIRYEIVKKRIDKANVIGTTERITQPGTVAIIYTQEKEAREYDRYFEFLEARGYILNAIEHLDVEPLQGIHGLKAMRIKVNYDEEKVKSVWNREDLIKQADKVRV